MKSDVSVFLENMSRKFKFDYDMTRTTGSLRMYNDLHTFIMTSRSIFLRMRNIFHKRCRENQNTDFIFTLFQK